MSCINLLRVIQQHVSAFLKSHHQAMSLDDHGLCLSVHFPCHCCISIPSCSAFCPQIAGK
jgi:hypothetical protein